MSNVGRLAVEDPAEFRVRRTHTSTHYVFLVLTCELTTRNQKEGSVLSRGCCRAIAKAPKPNVEILLEFGGFLFLKSVMRNESNVNEAKRLLENGVDLFLKKVLGRFRREIVRYFHH